MASDLAASAIERSEEEVRALIGRAAQAGDYGLVQQLTLIAQRLADLASDARSPRTEPKPSPARNPPQLRRSVGRKQGYPRFERENDHLLKIGWSKKERAEYVHKAPKNGLDALVESISRNAEGGRVFSAEDLLPIMTERGDELPGYQAYICLAFLRAIGLIEQRGRGGYAIACEDLRGSVSTLWASLPPGGG